MKHVCDRCSGEKKMEREWMFSLGHLTSALDILLSWRLARTDSLLFPFYWWMNVKDELTCRVCINLCLWETLRSKVHPLTLFPTNQRPIHKYFHKEQEMNFHLLHHLDLGLFTAMQPVIYLQSKAFWVEETVNIKV